MIFQFEPWVLWVKKKLIWSLLKFSAGERLAEKMIEKMNLKDLGLKFERQIGSNIIIWIGFKFHFQKDIISRRIRDCHEDMKYECFLLSFFYSFIHSIQIKQMRNFEWAWILSFYSLIMWSAWSGLHEHEHDKCNDETHKIVLTWTFQSECEEEIYIIQ